ncbi:Spx/MgsR family RNA polymerase-binding regulatory protein [Aquibacillus halophilus]|uniref:Spx/MgsR family RNA polymerase-binding regulatory protein n=1 Tax=Aquibacillus halophilus TaxID=930132 RepID=A0A6A8DNR8_9BACI|nr:arsenate reductase family protein [Aquibacillus halophilus]MRH44697.1 Spx/MgsR family RNA polymerase-binding regulatory protein [Aquibacillus halophilus]
MALNFYWYPKCSTCQQAKKWFDRKDIKINEIHIVESPPSKKELKTIIENSGYPLKKFFNTSGKKYRELGLKDKLIDATESQQLDWLTSDGMLIKRPIVTDGQKVTIGFKEEIFEQTWK